MHKKISLVLALIAAVSLMLSAQQVIRVRSAAELVRAIGSNKTIELAPGKYSLKDAYAVKNTSIQWTDAGSGQKALLVRNVSNLIIYFAGDSGVAEIVSSSPYALVFEFEDCESISLQGLTLGHEAQGPCSAGVVAFRQTQEISVRDCDIYGSGSVGLEFSSCSSATVSATTIRDCSAGAIWIDSSSSLGFVELAIRDNEGSYPLLNVTGSQDVFFDSCEFTGNSGDEFVYVDEGSENVGFEYCTIGDNDIETLSSSETYPYFSECSVSGNPFDDELAGLIGGGEGDGDYFGDGADDEFSHYALPLAPLGFYYPSWYELQEADEGTVMVSDPEGSAGLLILKAYTLVKADKPDTQAAAMFKKAASAFQKILTEKGVSFTGAIGEDFLNSEAAPYYYTYTKSFTLAGDSGYAFIKLVHVNGEVWAFAAMATDLDPLAEDSYLRSILDSIESLEE